MGQQQGYSCLVCPPARSSESSSKGKVLPVESCFPSQPALLLLMQVAKETAHAFRKLEQLLQPLKPHFSVPTEKSQNLKARTEAVLSPTGCS